MSKSLKDNINSQYVEAANALRGKQSRRRIVAYVESYDDIYFWRTVLAPFENDKRYFEVMLPSKLNLTRGKKSVLMNFISGERQVVRGERQEVRGERIVSSGERKEVRGERIASAQETDLSPLTSHPSPLKTDLSPLTPHPSPLKTDLSPLTPHPSPLKTDPSPLGDAMIACVDADYDYLMEGATEQSRKVLRSPYVFHTYVYAIENFQCYAPSLHDVCVAVTLNDHRIFDFQDYFQKYSEACFPLFVWSVWAYRTGRHGQFSLTDFNRVCDPGGFSVQNPQPSIDNIKRKVGTKVRELQRQFPDNKEAYLKVKADLRRLGVTPQTTYLYMQGHHLFDSVAAPILTKVCNLLRQERQAEIYQSQAHRTQKRNEMSCYENSQQDVKAMLKKNTGYILSDRFRQLQADVAAYLK